MVAAVLEQARVPGMISATLMFAGVRRLGTTIAETQVSRTMLGVAAELLHVEAAAKLLATSMFGGPLPPLPGSIDAARRIVATCLLSYRRPSTCRPTSSGAISPASPLSSRTSATTYSYVPGSSAPQLPARSGIRGETAWCSPELGRGRGGRGWPLPTCTPWKPTGSSRDLCTYWYPHRAEDLSLAEENLHDAMNLMEEALEAMHQAHDAFTLQSYETGMIFRHQA